MKELLYNEYVVWCAMAIIVFVITQLVKQPIKSITKRVCKTERKRRIANISIYFIPFILGVLLEIAYCTWVIKTGFTVLTGLGYGMSAISLYHLIERFFKVEIANPYESEEGQAVINLIEDVTGDGKIDYQDIDAVKNFLKKFQ